MALIAFIDSGPKPRQRFDTPKQEAPRFMPGAALPRNIEFVHSGLICSSSVSFIRFRDFKYFASE